MGLAVLGMWAATACTGSESEATVRNAITASGVAPVVVAGNPTCPAGYTQFKIDPPNAGTYSNADGFEVEIGYTDGYLWFDANQGVDIVYVKGGEQGANMYVYDPERSEDSGLITPNNPNGMPAGYSHVTFCYDEDALVPLEIEKTATTHAASTFVWNIDKNGACPDILFNGPYQYMTAFSATVTAARAEAGWVTDGTITIRNPNTHDATLTGVTDVLDGTPVDVDCAGVTFPYVLGGHETLSCTYTAATATQPAENSAEVTTNPEGGIDGNTVTVQVAVGDPAAATDDCVTVYDRFEDRDPVTLGTVCVGDLDANGQHRFDYETLIEVTSCSLPEETFELVNTAWFVTDDTETMASDSFTTYLTVRCPEACPTDPTLKAAWLQRSTLYATAGCNTN